MKKIKLKNKTIIFICSFFLFLIIAIILDKLFGFRTVPPYSWEKIWHNLYVYIIGALIFVAWALLTYDDKDKD